MAGVRLHKVGKRYKYYTRAHHRLLEWLSGGLLRRHRAQWVVRGVSLELGRGDALALVGANGSGKSTLLRMVAGTTLPNEGRVEVEGRVVALELGLGFHEELTGRQNVHTTGELLGMSAAELEARLPEIEEFAEIGEAIDDPVRTYSSGMKVRLAFAAATVVRPEVLIVDEVLAVGDAYFQQKCIARIERFRDEGTILLFVSHDPAAVRKLSERALLLDGGLPLREGRAADVLDYYNALVARRQEEYRIAQSEGGEGARWTRSGSGDVRITDVELRDEKGPAQVFTVGSRMQIRVRGRAERDVDEVTVGVALRDRLGNDCFGTNTHHLGLESTALRKGQGFESRLELPMNLGVGSYTLTVALHVGPVHVMGNYDWWDDVQTFHVIPGREPVFVGTAYLPAEASFELREGSGDAEGGGEPGGSG